jgi:hypothetical protein
MAELVLSRQFDKFTIPPYYQFALYLQVKPK